jgi:NAD+ synthase (glutamine-hydrolysing)
MTISTVGRLGFRLGGVNLRLGLAQINTVVGDLDGNRTKLEEWIERAKEQRVDMLLFPELAITGYPPEDLVLRPGFVRAAEESLGQVARKARGIVVLVGAPLYDRDLYNACAVCAGGEVKAVYRKRFLPNYGVFDEDRYFAPGRDLILLEHGKTLAGVTICEDMWQPGPPATDLSLAGAELLVNLSASPFHLSKDREREEMLITRARDNACFVALCNAVGGQDELIFDGHSVVIDDEGEVLARAPGFVDIDPEAVIGRRLRDVRRRALERERTESPPVSIVHVGVAREPTNGKRVGGEVAPLLDELEQMRLALELGLRDYVQKNGFSDVVIGVSGGIDSALTAALAVEALGAERVHCVSMPSRYSSEGTRRDAKALAETLGTHFLELPIDHIYDAFESALAGVFEGREPDLAEENLQARSRGVILMALSNKFGWLVIATGNKSELSVGYATLYGDMAGGFALLKDVYKTDVFRLAKYLNSRYVSARAGEAGTGSEAASQATPQRELIPQSIIDRAPSAELRADQLDEDSLPPYPKLDKVLEAYVELDRSREELSTDGFETDVVERAIAMIDRAEYKRRQAPPGVKLRPKAFGRDRRTPITNRWRD